LFADCIIGGASLSVEQVLSASFTKLTLGPQPSQSSTVSVTRSYPHSIQEWSGFAPEQFELSMAVVAPLIVKAPLPNELVVRSEAQMENLFIFIIAATLNQLHNEIGTIDKRTNVVPAVNSLTKCDEIGHDGNRVFTVQEMKLFNNLIDMPNDAATISRNYGDGIDLQDEERDRKWCRVVAQAYGYMLDQGVCYGIISCYNRTWFIHALVDGIIEISNAFACDGGSLLRAYAYFMKRAKGDSSELASVLKENRRFSGGGNDGSDINADSPPDDHAKDSNYSGDRGRKRPSTGSSSSSGGSRSRRPCTQNNAALTNTDVRSDPAYELDMALCHHLTNIGEGRSGLVISCVYKGNDIAVKLVDRNKGGVKTLDGEKQVYVRLAQLQGGCVPVVVSYNVVSRGGTMVGFAMEKLDPLPDDFAQWSALQRRGAVNALKSLAGLGIIHGDIRGANFGLRGDDVVVFDFECVSQCTETGRYPSAYRRGLKALSTPM
jgi:hypothetical protein